MSSNALNAVYKSAVLAVEECPVLNVSSGATSLTLVATKYMVAAPFVVGQRYALSSDITPASANDSPNGEWSTVTDVSNVVATPSDEGFIITGTLGITGDGDGGGTVNSYGQAGNASILTPGMEICVQSGDFNCRFKTLTDAPKVDFDDEASRFASGDEGRDKSIAGARSAEIDITQKLAWAGTDSGGIVAPVWAKIMRVMGHIVRRYTDGSTQTGIGFLPHTWANEVTATIWVFAPENGTNPTSTVYRYRGAHGGNGSSVSTGKIGDPYMLTGKFSAAYVGTMELPLSQARVLTSPDTQVPEVMLNNLCSVPAVYGKIIPDALAPTVNCASFVTAATANAALNLVGKRFYTADGTDFQDGALATAKGDDLVPGDAFTGELQETLFHVTYAPAIKNVEISQFSLDFGGVVNPFGDQSTSTGNAHYATQDRDPRLNINPYHVKKTLDDIDSLVTNMITGPVTIKSAPSNPHITIVLPNAQLLSPAIAAREGYLSTTRVYRPLRNNLTGSPVDDTLPDGMMYEVLIGARAFPSGEPSVPATPVLISPAVGEVGVSNNPNMSWRAAAGALTYQLEITLATDTGFASTVTDISGITGTSEEIYSGGPSEAETGYIWRVKATNDTGSSEWSETRLFTTVVGG